MVSAMIEAVTGHESANERFKRGWGRTVATGVIVAVAGHLAVVLAFPRLQADDLQDEGSPTTLLTLPPEVEIPEPPRDVIRPATPRVGDVEVDDSRTMVAPDWNADPPVPGPPSAVQEGRGDQPIFIPYDVAPGLRNEEEVARALEREYPPALRQAGVGGRVVLWIHVDAAGRVTDTRVRESSGHRKLDEAAREVARTMRFSPALNRDRPTPVWVQQAIRFEVR